MHAICIEELSEEDQQLKNELEMLVSRLKAGPMVVSCHRFELMGLNE